MTLDDKLVYDLPCWDNVTPMAKDLITRLLMKDPKQRITLDNAMAHPWFDSVRARYAAHQNLATCAKKKSSFANSNKPMTVHQ